MRKYYLQYSICSLLSVPVFFISCNGQVSADSSKNSHDSHPDDTTTTAAEQPKLKRTQGTNEYANIYCGLLDKAGNLWFGTFGEGVYRYDARLSARASTDGNGGVGQGKFVARFTTQDGLIHNGVFCIVEDKSGNIWFGTRNIGLCRYDGKTFTSFSE